MTQSASTLSNLPTVRIKRWISLILCSVTASLLLFFLSEWAWLQAAFTVYSKIITANIWVYHASAFIAGIAIKVLLDRFRVTHPKRIFRPNFSYPPITISIWLTILIISCFTIFSKDDSKELIFLMFESKALSQICLIISGICISHLTTSNKLRYSLITLMFISILFIALKPNNYLASDLVVYCYSAMLILFIFLEKRLIKADSNFVSSTNETSKKEVENFRSKEEFQSWFKDDTPINTIEQLEPDYQVYANRIYDRLINKEKETEDLAQQIALCGPFGCGKSSIIASIVKKLKQNTYEKTNKINWLHCDISTWGIQADHVAQVVLIHVIDTIAEKLDMCAFRSLPKHYVEAMKGGGSHWQIMAALLNKTTDVETCLAELNSVLATKKINLLITIQDIDRGTSDDIARRLNELAALLDRLKSKSLNKINFIIALGNENHEQAEIVSKITNRTEHILKKDTRLGILNYIRRTLEYAIKHNNIIILSDHTSGTNKNELHTLTIETQNDVDRIFVKTLDDDAISSYSPHEKITRHKNNVFHQEINALSNIVDSPRLLKKILRRVDEAWTSDKLMGEINIISLIMLSTLREVRPKYFSKFQQEYDYLYKTGHTKISIENIQEIVTGINGNVDKTYADFIIIMLGLVNIDIFNENASAISKSIDNKTEKFLMLDPRISACQTFGSTDTNVDYLKRFNLEEIPKAEKDEGYIDQTITHEAFQFLRTNLALNAEDFIEAWFQPTNKQHKKYTRFLPLFYRFPLSENLNEPSTRRIFAQLHKENKLNTFNVKSYINALIKASLTIDNIAKIANAIQVYENRLGKTYETDEINYLENTTKISEYLIKLRSPKQMEHLLFKYAFSKSDYANNPEVKHFISDSLEIEKITQEDIKAMLSELKNNKTTLNKYPKLRESIMAYLEMDCLQ
ncbi:KAP family NTPase [Shewanella sp. SM29]|uniref:KAP family NTPase n=1 Tax=Shewanella sp. SM29 TaxID=2912795 RepID=UPI0021D829D6|nr:KAP family NTPase [Shewanella sp. SM29]MCU8076276.1 KAP family NTPase [Shewanella sp. SM29]